MACDDAMAGSRINKSGRLRRVYLYRTKISVNGISISGLSGDHGNGLNTELVHGSVHATWRGLLLAPINCGLKKTHWGADDSWLCHRYLSYRGEYTIPVCTSAM